LNTHIRPHAYQRSPLSIAVALALLTLAAPTHAQQAGDDTAPMQKIEITGSSIKRVAADQALPVTVVKVDDWIAQGALTISDILLTMSTGADFQPNTTSGTGNSANMRGIGTARTLVLLDGKRMNNSPIDPNTIPVSALDRTEVLRDGASSVYGSDAIGGVINFVSKKVYTGASITAKANVPSKSGGGESAGLSFIAGKGNLGTDGWNVYVTGDINHQEALSQSSRPNITSAERRLGAGFAAPKLSTGGNAIPANVTLANGSNKVNGVTISGNPYYATGCMEGFSTPGLANTCVATANANSLALTAEKQQESLFSKGSLMLGDDNKLSASLLHTSIYVRPVKNPTFGINASVPGFPALTISPTSPFYPGKGITPAMPGITNQTLTLAWSLIGDLGPTYLNYNTALTRLTVDDEGHLGAWDYKVGLWSTVYSTRTTFRSGFVNSYSLLAGVANGQLNPFGLQNQAGKEYLASISTNGETANNGLTRMSGTDVTASRELMDLPGGALALAAGAGMYHDSVYTNIPTTVILSGGQTGNTAAINARASRNVMDVYAELNAPLTKALELNLAVRTDRYSDFGSTTNPKLSLRFRPWDWVMLRSAAGTGFRAPTLTERYIGVNNGATGITSTSYNDPVLCPGGAPGATTGGTALAGYNPASVCNARQPINTGANPNVGPEKSKTFTLGLVFTPTPSLLVSVDYFKVQLRNVIGQLAQPTLFTDPQYAVRFIRDAKNNLLYIDNRLNNLGGERTDGIDLTTTYQLPKTAWGTFGVQLDGTYINAFETQVTPGGAWISSVNKFGPLDTNVFTFRWKYDAAIKWRSNDGNWNATLNQQYKQSFQDLNASSTFAHRIDSYTIYNASVAYTGFKNVTVRAGINNMFDRDPPSSNYRNEGFASGMASPIGRSVNMRASYNF
jgi:iron complex outermembrane receptor protein